MPPPATPGGRRTRQLRSAARGLRERRPRPHGTEGDPDVLALVETPYADVEDARQRLQALLAQFEATDDRRAVFLAIYARMTGAVAARVRRGAYEDPAWVGDYLVEFANHYRVAVRDYEAGDVADVPDAWQLAFDAADRGDALVVQDAALGVNAHVNYDLALALDDVGVGPDRETRYADHHAVTDVIRGLVDEAQSSLAARDAAGLETLDDSLGGVDEWLTVTAVDQCRDSAWRTACALDSRFRLRRRFARWVNDVTSTGAAHLILSTQASDAVHETLDDLESAGDAG